MTKMVTKMTMSYLVVTRRSQSGDVVSVSRSFTANISSLSIRTYRGKCNVDVFCYTYANNKSVWFKVCMLMK